MIDLAALTFGLLSLLDPTVHEPEGPRLAPLEQRFPVREDIRLPWKREHRYLADGPYSVEMVDVLAEAAEQPPVKTLYEAQGQPLKGRIPGSISPELAELYRLETLFLAPSDRIQVLDEGRFTKTLTSSRANDAIDFADSGSVPPDAEIAAGPSHVIVAVNRHFQIFSASTGQALSSVVSTATLMGSGTGSQSNCASGLFDPNLLYDEQNGRFLIGMSKGTDYCLAVSQSGNPLGTWTTYSIATDIGGFFFDYPHLGIGRQALYFASNQFFDEDDDGGLEFQESRLFALDKTRLFAGQSVSVVSWSLAVQGGGASPQPLKVYGEADGTWPTSGPDYLLTRSNNNSVHVWTIDDPLGAGLLTRQSGLSLTNHTGVSVSLPGDPPQLGGDEILGGDTRALDFEYRDGFGWTVQSVSCNPGSGSVSCVRWAKLDLAANTIADAGVFAFADSHAIYPDLAVNRCGDMLVGFTRSDSSRYPSVWVAGRESTTAAGTLSFSQEQKAGTAAYFDWGGSPYRYGDYTGATIGPDGTSLWYVGQLGVPAGGLSANWSTHFARYVFPDTDSDGVPDSCDLCAGSNDEADSDGDGVPDGCDLCAGSDDSEDADGDGVPDGCDACDGDDASGNSDGDAYCDDIDICSAGDDDLDADGDAVPDACDACDGDDASGNSDGDAYCDDVDICSAGDDDLDADGDSVPDACDACLGDDDSGNGDGDLYCTDIDICLVGDDDIDSDSDGTPDACDLCFGSDDADSDGDGVCDDRDDCEGDDATGNVDRDGLCADLDCDDDDGLVLGPDRCDVCFGDGTSCTVLFPIGDPFAVTTTTAGAQGEPSVAAGAGGFLVTWSSSDGSGNGIRGRLFDPAGEPDGDDFQINDHTSGSQDFSAAAPVADGDGFIVAWESDNLDGSLLAVAGRLVEGGAVGSEMRLNDAEIGSQQRPTVIATADGFQAAWQGNRFGGDTGETVVGRRFLADGTAATTDIGFTADGSQILPDLAGLPAGGGLVSWIDEDTSVRVRPVGADGSTDGDEVQVDNSGTSAAVAVDGQGRGLITWAEASGDGTDDAAVFVRRVDSDGAIAGPRRRVSPSADGDQEAPDVAALADGGYVVVYQDGQTGEIRAQLYDGAGEVAQSVDGALVGEEPFAVSTNTSATAVAPAVAVDQHGTFFVAWSDSAVDGAGTGIAGRLFGTDVDSDELPGASDNCPLVANPDQQDTDSDGAGDACDGCPTGDDSFDADADGTPDGCDTCTDLDGDGAGDAGFPANTCALDNCPAVENPNQADGDSDGLGDVCDSCTDSDGDGAGDPGYEGNTCAVDNCPADANADQADADADGIGDVCDLCTGVDASGDGDGDGVCADRDCDDGDPGAQSVDGCGVCGGDDACVLFSDGFESGDVSAWSELVEG
ncbi:MAG: hypothetical protein AAGM22_04050 [Acidobacteriota bacterium]